MTVKVLLVDDDQAWCHLVDMMLTQKGFQIDIAHNALSGLQRAYASKPDLILLDIMMPGMDGRETCRRFREMTDVPIILLTALSATGVVVEGLELGADDYIIKPVTADVLEARIRAVLRRTSRQPPNGSDVGPVFTYANLVIDFENRQVSVAGKGVELTPIEFSLLSVLVRNRGRVLSHEFLLREVWGPQYIGEMSYLRLYIRYLRRKLEKDPANPQLIHSEWGVGYRFG
jgi:two-component system KDP operon response regulator KdpE